MAFRVAFPRTLADTPRKSLVRVERDFFEVERNLRVRIPFPSLRYSHDRKTAELIDRNFAEIEKKVGTRIPFPSVWHTDRRIFHMRIDRNFEELEPLGLLLYHAVYAGTTLITANRGLPNHGQHAGTTVLTANRGLPNHGQGLGTAVVTVNPGLPNHGQHAGTTVVTVPVPGLDFDFEDGTLGPFTQQSAGTWTNIDDGTGNRVMAGNSGGTVHRVRYTTTIYGPEVAGVVHEMSARIRFTGSGTYLAGIHFGGTGAGVGGYQVFLDRRNGSGSTSPFQARRDTSQSQVLDTDTSPTISTNAWYTILVHWEPATGDTEAWLYDASNVQIGYLSYTNTTYNSGRFGFYTYNNNSQFDDAHLAII